MSNLEKISVQYRKPLIAKNSFDKNDEYTVAHDDALSTGDEPGKGEKGGLIGSATDIKTRKILLVKNKWKTGYMYNATNA